MRSGMWFSKPALQYRHASQPIASFLPPCALPNAHQISIRHNKHALLNAHSGLGGLSQRMEQQTASSASPTSLHQFWAVSQLVQILFLDYKDATQAVQKAPFKLLKHASLRMQQRTVLAELHTMPTWVCMMHISSIIHAFLFGLARCTKSLFIMDLRGYQLTSSISSATGL